MRILLFILSLLFCVSVDAQKLVVESFEQNAFDLVASTEERVDLNHVPCALVKVWLAAPGAVFTGNVVGDVAYDTSEYRVYMSKGSKRVLVKLEGYLPLRVEFPEPLKSRATYLLTISGVTGSVNKEDNKQRVATVRTMPGRHEYVDLGLSVNWATCNVGATQPWEYGDYYAWAETEPKSEYSWGTYKHCEGTFDSITKYYTSSPNGAVDIYLEDDVAHVEWGGSWRMPNRAELAELREECIWTWTTQNDVNGYIVTSKQNGNSIFLPAAGSRFKSDLGYAGANGGYWSSSLYGRNYTSACCMSFDSRGANLEGYGSRYIGQSVRPVCP